MEKSTKVTAEQIWFEIIKKDFELKDILRADSRGSKLLDEIVELLNKLKEEV